MLHREFAEPEPFVKYGDARPLAGGVLVKREIAAQTGVAAAVIDVARLNQISRSFKCQRAGTSHRFEDRTTETAKPGAFPLIGITPALLNQDTNTGTVACVGT